MHRSVEVEVVQVVSRKGINSRMQLSEFAWEHFLQIFLFHKANYQFMEV